MQALIKPDSYRRQLIAKTCGAGQLVLPHVEDIYLISLWIAGTRYYHATAAASSLAESCPIHLRREPENPHDTLAIEALTETGLKLGHVPREHNRVLARLMDAGKYIHAKLARIDLTHVVPKIRARVYMQNL